MQVRDGDTVIGGEADVDGVMGLGGATLKDGLIIELYTDLIFIVATGINIFSV
jgi:hypothetical protein